MNFSRRDPNAPEVIPTHVVLASQSVGRRGLLEKLGLKFKVAVARINEEAFTDKEPLKQLKKRATAKADEVAKHPRVYNIAENAKTLIIAADSEAILGKNAYGKPADREDAKKMLRELMDKTHTFVTAVNMVLLEGHIEKKRWEKQVSTKVTLAKLGPTELESYIGRYDLTRFAASHSLSDAPWPLVTKIDGSYTNVVGLPFEVLLPVLKQLELII